MKNIVKLGKAAVLTILMGIVCMGCKGRPEEFVHENAVRKAAEKTGNMMAEAVKFTGATPFESIRQAAAEMKAVKVQQDEQRAAEEARKAEEEAHKKQAASRLIVIDAGHQETGNSDQEPVGPGAQEMKAKVASGTSGRVTGVPEYVVTLQVAQKLEAELQARGYQVLMVRTENNVNISNAERAGIANENHAAAFLRIHCNGAENSSANGAMTICMTPDNPYCGELYPQSRRLSDAVLDALCSRTQARAERVWETDTMSGINWCQVPVTIVEMGYMSNPQEDQKLVSDGYQDLLACGIADGVDAYFASEMIE